MQREGGMSRITDSDRIELGSDRIRIRSGLGSDSDPIRIPSGGLGGRGGGAERVMSPWGTPPFPLLLRPPPASRENADRLGVWAHSTPSLVEGAQAGRVPHLSPAQALVQPQPESAS